MSAIITVDIKLSLAEIAAIQKFEATQDMSKIPPAVANQVVQAVKDLEFQVQPKKAVTTDDHEAVSVPADTAPPTSKHVKKNSNKSPAEPKPNSKKRPASKGFQPSTTKRWLRSHTRSSPPSAGTGSMPIFVKTMTGRTLVINTEPDSGVREVMKLVQEADGLPYEQQRLIFAGRHFGKPPEDDDEEGPEQRTLAEHGIMKESTLHLVLRLCGS